MDSLGWLNDDLPYDGSSDHSDHCFIAPLGLVVRLWNLAQDCLDYLDATTASLSLSVFKMDLDTVNKRTPTTTPLFSLQSTGLKSMRKSVAFKIPVSTCCHLLYAGLVQCLLRLYLTVGGSGI